MTMGYFTGYIHKAQPIGLYELKKCMDKQHMLRERLCERSERDKAPHLDMRARIQPRSATAHSSASIFCVHGSCADCKSSGA